VTKDRARKKVIRARMAASGEPYSVAARNLGAGGPAGDAAAVSEIVDCASSTLAAPSVRIAFRQDWNVPPAARRRGARPGGGAQGPIETLARLVGRAGWERATRGLEFGHIAGEGFLEPAAGRYMIGYGPYAQVHTGGKTFGGRLGRPLRALRPSPARMRTGEVLWLLRLLPGTTDARPEGTEMLRGTLCRKFAVQVDLARAAAADAAGLPTPSGISSGQPPELALSVWIDGRHIRQVRFADRGPEDLKPRLRNLGVAKVLTLELWDFGVSLAELDWSPDEHPDIRLTP